MKDVSQKAFTGFHGESVYWCFKCDAWWLRGQVTMACCVMHAPGECCHMSETRVTVRESQSESQP